MIQISVKGANELVAKLGSLMADTKNKRPYLAAAGRYMVGTEVPTVFREGGPGWPPPKYRRGQPLLDTGILRNSIAYRVVGNEDVRIGTPLKYARIHQLGGTVTPVNRQWLAIPLSPPLSISERRTKGPRDFPGAFVLMKGPEGPGIYRKSGAARSVSLKTRRTSYRSGTLGIERIFAFRKSVKIPPRPFLRWSPRAVAAIKAIWERMLLAAARRAAA